MKIKTTAEKVNEGNENKVPFLCDQEEMIKEDWEEEFNNKFGFGIWTDKYGSETYSSDIVEFIRNLLTERDNFWESQEIGKSSDCAKHEADARTDERNRIADWAEKNIPLDVYLPDLLEQLK